MKICRVLFFAALFLNQTELYPESEGICRLEGDKLIYGTDEKGNRIPDFSYVGYMSGNARIPDVKVLITLDPSGEADDTARIQSAIDRLSASSPDEDGIRGALVLEKGTFKVAGTLKIRQSGIVLRGRGQSRGGTVILASGKLKRNVIEAGDMEPLYPRLFFLKRSRPSVEVADAYIPAGSRELRLKDGSSFKAGDRIMISYPVSKEWIHDIGMDRIGDYAGKDRNIQWNPERFYQLYERKIVSVFKDLIVIDAPLVNAIDAGYGGASVCGYADETRLRNCGIENMRIISEYDTANPADEEHASTAVAMDKLADSWVKNVSAEHMLFSCVNLEGNCRNITVQDCSNTDPVSIIDGGRRYGFQVNGQLNLVQRCYSSGDRHAFVTNGRVRGPNVFLDCLAENTHGDIGPHQAWATGTLYDNISAPDGGIFLQNRGTCGNGHGWAGANEVLWNCNARDLICEKPPTAQNYCIGSSGIKHSGYTRVQESGHWESHNVPVKPRSLYIQQLIERNGREAALNVVEKRQLEGSLERDSFGR